MTADRGKTNDRFTCEGSTLGQSPEMAAFWRMKEIVRIFVIF